jgi:hygromycin-B 7''-O-kinase
VCDNGVDSMKVPSFSSVEDYVSRLPDVDFWRPYVAEALHRHDLLDDGQALRAGFNATYPTFLYGDFVVKLFGCSRAWQHSHWAERAAYRLLAGKTHIAAPALVAEGQLGVSSGSSWPYLITRRVGGRPWRGASFSQDQRLRLAGEMGSQIQRVHALHPTGAEPTVTDPSSEAVAAAQHSCLPPHLVAQVETFLSNLRPYDAIFVHGDLVQAHVFLSDAPELTGIIDWGDALVIDRHYELGKLYFELFDCDKMLLRAFLEASAWPVDANFPRQAMGLALHRQAIGIAQHHTFDVFEPVARHLPLAEIASLDDLAMTLFTV